jgi:VWFA-related protein
MKIVNLPVSLLLCAGFCSALPGPSKDKPAPDATGATHTITLDVAVTDKSGAAVPGLEPADFKLLDNKRQQSLSSVVEAHGMAATADPPVEAMVVMDAVNSDFRAVANERQLLEKLFKANGGEMPLPTSLVVLREQEVSPRAAATRDGNALLEQLNTIVTGLHTINRGNAFWGATERRQLSLQAFGRIAVEAANRPGRKLVIWIGPGWPALDSTGVDTTGVSPREQEALFSTITEISTAMWLSHITLYDIDSSEGSLGGQFNYENFVKGADSPRHVDNGDLMLQVLAVQSGGAMLYGNDLPGLIARCMADTKSYYVVKYPAPPAAHANEYHLIEVKLDKPGLKARTRTVYYSQP